MEEPTGAENREARFSYSREQLLGIRDKIGKLPPLPNLPPSLVNQNVPEQQEGEWRNVPKRELRGKKKDNSWISSETRSSENLRRYNRKQDLEIRYHQKDTNKILRGKEFSASKDANQPTPLQSEPSTATTSFSTLGNTSISKPDTVNSSLTSSLDVDAFFSPENERLKTPLSLEKDVAACEEEPDIVSSGSKGFSRWFGIQEKSHATHTLQQEFKNGQNDEKTTQIDINNLFATAAKYESQPNQNLPVLNHEPEVKNNLSEKMDQRAQESASFISSLMMNTHSIYSPNHPDTQQNENSFPIALQMMLQHTREYERGKEQIYLPRKHGGETQSDLTRWFGETIYESPLPPMPQQEGKMLTVEEIEKLLI